MYASCNSFRAFFVMILLTRTTFLNAQGLRQEPDSANIIERFYAARDGVGHLSLPVTVQNKTYLFILDTGSTGIIYDASFRPILGKPRRIEKAKTDASNVELMTFDSPEALIGRINLKGTSGVVVSDLSNLREWSGVEYYGIIGMRFLRNYIIRIDFDTGEVTFLKSLNFKPGAEYPLTLEHGVIYTQAMIPGCDRKEKFLIDTGSDRNGAGTLSPEFFDLLVGNHIVRPLSIGQGAMTLSGMTSKALTFRLNTFSLAAFTHRNLIFSTFPKCENKLSLGYLSRYIVTFDFPRQVMYLEKGKMYDLPDGIDRSGLSLSRRGGKTVVSRVGWLSPAWWSGIKPKDIILEIDGNNANRTSLYSLRRLLGMGGKKVNVVLLRGQERIETILSLSRADDSKSNKEEGSKENQKGSKERKTKESGLVIIEDCHDGR